MTDIKAGVVLVSKFCKPGKVFKDYVNYIDRNEATRNNNMFKFNLFNDYMANPQKTTSLFNDSKDELNNEEKKQIKELFNLAESNESIMWQHVISYDNRWLKEQGLFNNEGMVNENKIKELTRIAMTELQKNEELQNAIWTAAIHYNTDNIHVHIAMVEPVPMRQMKGEERRGKLKQSSLDKTKSAIVNDIIRHQPENELINQIIRDNIIQSTKRNPLINDKEFIDLFMEVHRQLPNDKRQWNYNCNAIKDIRPKIDRMTDIYINKYHKEDMAKLDELLKIQDEKYKTAYGTSRRGNYSEGKKKDLYYRMGNTILKQIKEFDKAEKERIYQSAKKRKNPIRQEDFNIYKNKKLRYYESQYKLKTAIEFTKIFMKDEFESIKNRIAYEVMQQEIEFKSQIEKEN